MKQLIPPLILALISVSLLNLSSCAKPVVETKIEYVYLQPAVPDIQDTLQPSIKLRVWGDYPIYKAQCATQINKCNADKKAIIRSISTAKE